MEEIVIFNSLDKVIALLEDGNKNFRFSYSFDLYAQAVAYEFDQLLEELKKEHNKIEQNEEYFFNYLNNDNELEMYLDKLEKYIRFDKPEYYHWLDKDLIHNEDFGKEAKKSICTNYIIKYNLKEKIEFVSCYVEEITRCIIEFIREDAERYYENIENDYFLSNHIKDDLWIEQITSVIPKKHIDKNTHIRMCELNADLLSSGFMEYVDDQIGINYFYADDKVDKETVGKYLIKYRKKLTKESIDAFFSYVTRREGLNRFLEDKRNEERERKHTDKVVLSDGDKELLKTILKYFSGVEWKAPANKDNMKLWVKTLFGADKQHLDDEDVNKTAAFRDFFKIGRSGNQDRATISTANIIGYCIANDYIPRYPKKINKDVFGNEDMTNNINKGINMNANQQFKDLLPFFDKYAEKIITNS